MCKIHTFDKLDSIFCHVINTEINKLLYNSVVDQNRRKKILTKAQDCLIYAKNKNEYGMINK